MKLKFLPKLLLVALLFCGSIAFAAEQDALFSNTWILDSLNGKAIDLSLYPDDKPNLKFGAGNRYSAWAGCNQISGSFILNGTTELEFNPNATMTKMFCAGPANIEDEFMKTIVKTRYWTVGQNMLYLQDEQFAELASFKQQFME